MGFYYFPELGFVVPHIILDNFTKRYDNAILLILATVSFDDHLTAIESMENQSEIDKSITDI